MSVQLLEKLLAETGLTDKAEKVSDTMYMFHWGSARVIAHTAGEAIVVLAPLFDALPDKDPDKFCRHLLALNARMGGTASFAIASDGSVVLQCGRGTKGLDSDEFALMLGTVGKFADDYDDPLREQFYE
jgi:hypothetical protein